jgi:hypothetical protein
VAGSRKPALPRVCIPCALSIGGTRTALDGNGLVRDEVAGDDRGGVYVTRAVGGDSCLGTKLAEEVGTGLGTESAEGGVRPAHMPGCWSVEVEEDTCSRRDVASGAPMDSDVHARATPDRAVATAVPSVTNSGSWS